METYQFTQVTMTIILICHFFVREFYFVQIVSVRASVTVARICPPTPPPSLSRFRKICPPNLPPPALIFRTNDFSILYYFFAGLKQKFEDIYIFFWAGSFVGLDLQAPDTLGLAKPGYAASLSNAQVTGRCEIQNDNNSKTKNRIKKTRKYKNSDQNNAHFLV